MPNYLKKDITYLGVDEHTPPILKGGFIVVVAETKEEKLSKISDEPIKKAKDYLREAGLYKSNKQIKSYKNIPQFPNLDDFKEQGLDNFYWTRANNGRFSRQLVEHASIAHVVSSNGYKPNSTVIMIDAFYGRNDMSVYLIQEYLKARDFNIPRENIIMVGGGDKSVPIINFADLLAFQIGLHLNKRYRQFNQNGFNFNIEPNKVDYDIRRVIKPLANEERNDLEKAIESWKNKSSNSKPTI